MAEICSFNKNNITITQYGGIVRGTTTQFNALSHSGYRATDIVLSSKNELYGPCKIKCIYHEFNANYGCVVTLFETVESVLCADKISRKMTFMLFHGGKANGVISSTPKVGTTYSKGTHVYQMGTDGIGTGAHIHLDVLGETVTDINGTFNLTKFNNSIVDIVQTNLGDLKVKAFNPNKSLNFHEVFFEDQSTIAFDTYAAPGYSTAQDTWGAYVNFTQYQGELNGWVDNGGTWYFYKDGVKVKGWLSEGGAWFYLDYTTGAMHTGWAADGKKWYYLNPDNGHMVTGWKWIDDAWYYLNPNDGGAMHTGWLYDGGNTYFMDGNGRMLKGGTFDIGGNKYTFDNNGCLVK